MEGLMYLHHPQILKSIQIIKNGEIGKIKNNCKLWLQNR